MPTAAYVKWIGRFPYLLFIILLISLALPAFSAERFKEADACRDALNQNPERKKVRKNWEQCVEEYKTRTFAPSSDRDNAAAFYKIGRLHQELYLYSNLLDDLEKARQWYKKVVQAAPEHPLSTDAKLQMEKLEPLLGPSFPKTGEDDADPVQKPEAGKRPDSAAGTSSVIKTDLATIANVRHWTYPKYTRVVIDLDRPVSYHIDRRGSAEVISVQLSGARLGELFKKSRLITVKDGVLKKIEISQNGIDQVEVLLTFKKLGPHKAVPLVDPDRLVIDTFHKTDPANPKQGVDLSDQVNTPTPPPIPPPPSFEIRTIVIDPGHGGKDPGAIGSRGLTEKEVVLDVSLRLKDLIKKRLKKEVVMTRDRDVFIPLEERTILANEKNADLFISVHANSSPKRHTQGIEVYLLGRATDENAIATAARENATSQKAVLDFQEIILNDLERDFTLNESLEFAHFTQNAFVENLIPEYPTVSLGVKRAPFFVLAHTKMPSILAEISFISNPVEEKRLRNGSYRQKVAEALFKGVEQYLHSFSAGP